MLGYPPTPLPPAGAPVADCPTRLPPGFGSKGGVGLPLPLQPVKWSYPTRQPIPHRNAQVSEELYHAVSADPQSTFYFEHSHKTFCKGFGSVVAYYVEGTKDPPPKALLQMLGIEHRVGDFLFHSVMGGPAQKAALKSDSSHTGGAAADANSTLKSASKLHTATEDDQLEIIDTN